MKSALRDWLSISNGMISILVISRCAAPPYPAAPDFLHGKACHTILRSLCSLTNRVPLPPHPGDRINCSMLSCRNMAPLLSTHSPIALAGEGRWWRQPPKGECISSPPGRLYDFRHQRRYKKWRRRRRTSPAGTVSQPIGKPFNGQAKGLLWLTWRPYAGPPQYYITPEGGALNPSGRRQPVPDRTLAAQGRKARRLAQPSRP